MNTQLKLALLNSADGGPVVVNTAYVTAVMPATGNGTSLYLWGLQEPIHITESVDTVISSINTGYDANAIIDRLKTGASARKAS